MTSYKDTTPTTSRPEEAEEDFSSIEIAKTRTPSIVMTKWQEMSIRTIIIEKDFYRFHDQIRTLISSWKLDADLISSLFGYAGFDVVAFRAKMTKELKAEEVLKLVLIFLTRGNNIKRIIGSTATSEAAQFLKSMTSTIGLRSQARGKTQAPTLARLTLSFPDVAAQLLISFPNMMGPVTLDHLKSALKISEIPAICRLPSLCCLIPRDAKFMVQAMDLFLYSNLCLSETINLKNQRWQKMTMEQRVRETVTYQKNALNSQLFNDEMRWWFCGEYGITAEGTKCLTAVWSQASEAATKKNRELFNLTYADL